jgi:hypothetical protein
MAVRPSDNELLVWHNEVVDGQPAGYALTVDRCTGLGKPLNAVTPGQGTLGALAFAPDGRLFGTLTNLFSIDTVTGELTNIGLLAVDGQGPLAVNVAAADFDASGVLYGVDLTLVGEPERFVTIDTTTGDVTVIGNLNPEIGTIGSIVFDPNGNLIGSNIGGGVSNQTLFDIDPATGAVSNFRNITTPQSGLSGLGFAPVCVLLAEPRTLYFGDVEVGSGSEQIVTLTNVGTDPMTVIDIDFVTGGSGEYSIASAALPIELLVAETLDITLNFSPTVIGSSTETLQITTTQGLVSIALSGEGVRLDLPPGEQIGAILDYFNESIANGTLMGAGSGNSGDGRMDAAYNMLEVAGDLIDRGLTDEACAQLEQALKRMDGLPRPPDFVEGDAAAELTSQIEAIRMDLGCF